MPEMDSEFHEIHEDRRCDQDWVREGCLPPDDVKERMARLKTDVETGKVPESERGRIATNAMYALATGLINNEAFNQVLDAVRVDAEGNLLDEDGERHDGDGNIISERYTRPD